MASVAVHSKAVVLLLLIELDSLRLLLLPLFLSFFLCLVLLNVLSGFGIILLSEREPVALLLCLPDV